MSDHVCGLQGFGAIGDNCSACEQMFQVATHQPPPRPNSGPCIQDLVIADINTRKQVGFERYGTLLQPFNGRDALMDAYQEALDLCQYLRQAIEERDHARTLRDPVTGIAIRLVD